ncbi:alkaline phosphatase-like protein [Polyplosphaeria fusca]|uniref:Alkaline phosphatase-like protein n=1 Tax=Polyplosphaeria fusca TaxID=682080 RepID=A0A9P4V4I4_9PLEO|nr:alkaline phosphatase-like protein [Polyplosphaeria fusca]
MIGEEDTEYLPNWLGKAGYKTEYIGKLMNGQDVLNWKYKPKGWDHVDTLIEPYTYNYNTVVMTANGKKPVWYNGWHQTDVIRAKALARLDGLTSQSSPWFLAIAPVAPHVQGGPGNLPQPLNRHKQDFSNIKVPKPDNFNTKESSLQKQKPAYMKNLPLLNDEQISRADEFYRTRIQAIQGIDEIVEDVIKKLDAAGQLENTYIIYTSDNGYHIGTHRCLAGKTQPYLHDTNIPLIVRHPSIQKSSVSKTASTHIDFAPTFLDIAGVAAADRPELFDGRSLLKEWQSSDTNGVANGIDREIINIEFWGSYVGELNSTRFPKNTYKTMRVVGEQQSWFYARWCTGETELYNTKTDPLELHNLAIAPVSAENQKTMDRLNALLLVTKSCAGSTCRNPWPVLKPENTALPSFSSLTEALNPKLDNYFASRDRFPLVQFKECLNIQLESNEVPFFPPEAKDRLGKEHRKKTDNYNKGTTGDCGYRKIAANGQFGSEEQRNAGLADVEENSRVLSDEEVAGNDCVIVGLGPA